MTDIKVTDLHLKLSEQEVDTILEALKQYADRNAKGCSEAINDWDSVKYLECWNKTGIAWSVYENIRTAAK